MIMEGILELQICNDTVPDFETANTELDKILNLILSSEATSVFSIFEFFIFSKIKFLLSSVA